MYVDFLLREVLCWGVTSIVRSTTSGDGFLFRDIFQRQSSSEEKVITLLETRM